MEKGDLVQGRDDLRGHVGHGFLPQPAQPRASSLWVRDEEPIEEGFTLLGQERGQPAKGLVMGLVACGGDQAFQAVLWFNRSGHRDKRVKMGRGGVD